MARKNPIEARLDVLHDQWTEFAQAPNARVLCWLAQPDEVAMVETFVAKESEPEATDTPDVFLRFDDPFELPDAHGFVLRESFIRAYEQARPVLAEQGLQASFVVPHAAPSDDDIGALLRVMLAFHAHQEGKAALVVLFLSPTKVRDPKAYQMWLQRFAHRAPSEVRIAVVDAAGAPALAELARVEPERVVCTPCALDMPQALEDISRDAGLDTPGGQLRHLLVKLGEAAKRVDLPSALGLAAAASQITTAMQWPHLGAVVQVMLAAVHLGAGNSLEALTCYAEVDRLGLETYARGESGEKAPEGTAELEGDVAKAHGLRLRRDARFGQGSVLIAMGAWEQAAAVYLETAPFCEAIGDARGQLDSFRLACLSYENAGRPHEAWQCGMKGLEVGGAVDDLTRRTSTLAFLGEGMLRLTKHSAYAAHAQAIDRHLQKLLGPDWRRGARA